MKRVIYFVSVVLAASIFVSCNNADDYSSESSIAALTTTTDNFSAVKSQIKDLGEEKFGDYYVTTRGEKWKKFWTGVKNVLLADARGAVKGLGNGEFLVHGIVASLEKALDPKAPDTTCQKKPLCVIAYSSDVKCNTKYSDSVVLSTGETLADSVGFYHNQTIIGSLSDPTNNILVGFNF